MLSISEKITAAGTLLLAAVTIVAIPMGAQNATNANANLQTVAEQSKFQRTGRYDEVERLCAAYARR